MIDTTISDLIDCRRSTDKEVLIWYGFDVKVARSIGVKP